MIVCIEGCIGVGKTTLTKKLAAALGGHSIFEEFENNPFLKDFYANQDSFAFHMQSTFLFLQSKQFLKAAAFEKGNNVFVDFHPVKSKVFSNIVIKDAAEFEIIQNIYHQLFAGVEEKVLIVYLKANSDVILNRIKQRNDPFAEDISPSYIESVINSYNHFFEHYTFPLIAIDTNILDFEKNESDWQLVKQQVIDKMDEIKR